MDYVFNRGLFFRTLRAWCTFPEDLSDIVDRDRLWVVVVRLVSGPNDLSSVTVVSERPEPSEDGASSEFRGLPISALLRVAVRCCDLVGPIPGFLPSEP